MESKVLLDSSNGVIGIAILTSVQAAIVHADINACHTTVFFPLVLILGKRQGLTDDAFQQFTVDTMPMTDAKPRQVNGFCTGFQHQVVVTSNIRKPCRQFVNFTFSKRSNTSFTLDTYTHMTTEMQKKASGIVGNFLDEIM